MTYYPEPNKHIRYKVKVVLEVKDATSVHNVDKLHIVPTGFNKLKTKIDDLNAGKIKTVSVDSKNVKTWWKRLDTKASNTGNKIPDAITSIYINQYHTLEESLEKKIGDVDKQIHVFSDLVTTTILTRKIGEVESKLPDVNCLVITIFLN